MAIAEVEILLKNYNHNKAISLLRKFGTSQTLIQVCSKEDAFSILKVRKELIQISEKNKPQIEIQKPTRPEKTADKSPIETKPKPYQKRSYSDYPIEIQEAISEKIFLRQKSKSLFEQLRDKPMEIGYANRKQNAFFIRNASTKILELQSSIDHYDNNGILKPELVLKEVIANDPVKLLRRQNTLRSYISHAKAGRKPKEKIQDWIKELIEIQNKLKNESI